jgi:hypothetical protein
MTDGDSAGTWLNSLVWGLLILALGVLVFWYFSGPTEFGGGRSWLVDLMKALGGRWTISPVCVVISSIFFYRAVKQMLAQSAD